MGGLFVVFCIIVEYKLMTGFQQRCIIIARMGIEEGLLMSNGERILLYFLSKKSLTRTEIMKYLYLYEYTYRKHIGKHGTELEFVRWDHGPFESSIYDTLGVMECEEVISSLTYYNTYGHLSHRYSSEPVEDNLSDSEKLVADYVIHELSHKTFTGMLGMIYATPPMLKVLEFEENEGRQLQGRVLPMNETKGIFRRTKSGREDAFQRLMSKERTRGTDQEYAKVMLREYDLHESLRRRAKDVAPRFDS